MNARRTLEIVVDALTSAGIDYMVTGSLAGSYHGVPRSTQDMDLVVDGSLHQFLDLAETLRSRDFYVSETAIREAVEDRGQFNVIDRDTAWKIDLILRKERPFSRTEFTRRREQKALGLTLWVATAEDIVLAKLEWAKRTGSDRQIEDVVGILEAQGDDLDRDYMSRWLRELELEDLWKRALDRAHRR